jgi:sec-independent protein translocase protein TatB
MPSFQDSAFLFILALLLFGPKKLPELARQLGKLMGEFRRASNEFRMQMDEELRIADQAEQQKKIAAMEAAAPVIPPGTEVPPEYATSETPAHESVATESIAPESITPAPLPIASAGDLSLMPPDTGLPIPRASESEPATNGVSEEHEGNAALTPVLETIPHTPDPATQSVEATNGFHLNGATSALDNHDSHTAEPVENSTEAPLHG